ncbi:MAG: porin family protein [Prevotella sp.]|nr:porin family protein [Prevotella sp.]
MKKLLAVIATAFITISASAQSEAGSFTLKPNVGFTYTTATGDWGEGADGAFALTAGVEGMYMVNEKFGAALGLNYTGYNTSQEVYTSLDGDKKEDDIYSNYYFNIPVMANYYVAPGFALKAGVALNILSTAKIDGKDKNAGHDVKDMYKSTFFSIPVGASYEINDFVFEARYNLGVSKVAENYDGTFNALTFTVGYKF